MQSALPIPGDLVWIRRQRWRVERALGGRDSARLDVTASGRRLTFLLPFDAPAPEPRHRLRRARPQRALARLASAAARAPDARLPLAALDARVEVMPFQLEPALALLAGERRLLVADEVGLGKTIQAALCVAELVRREPSPRVLLLVPATLIDQWIDELTARFRLPVQTATRTGLEAAARDTALDDSPWSHAGIWIASPDFLKQRHVREALPANPWDLIVIDEAHGVCGDSDRFALCQEQTRRARRLLLLTATPHDGDRARFARLLSLGALDTPASSPVVFRRTRADAGLAANRRVRWHGVTPSAAESRVFDELRAFERRVLRAPGSDRDRALLLLSVLRKRALSSLAALSRSLDRRLAWLGEPAQAGALDWLQPRLAFDDGPADDVGESDAQGLSADSGLDARVERSCLRRLRALAAEAASTDGKIARLRSLILRAAEPVVVFTEFRDSLAAVADAIRPFVSLAVLHGGQTADERRHELRRFLNGDAHVLVSTDVGGQGLNLQSRARWVVGLELPWNPARLEQRIGRVDRFGQTRAVHFTLLVSRDRAEAGLLRHLSRRALSARRALDAETVLPVVSDVVMARALLADAEVTVETAAPARVALCRRWRRPAIVAARALMTRRRLASCWRSAEGEGTTPVWAMHPRLARLLPPGHAACLVYSVPLLSDDDELLDRLLVAIAVGAEPIASGTTPALQQALARAIARVVSPRLARVMRRTRLASAAAIRRERALGRLVARARQEAQPQLFDRRSVREAERHHADRARLLSDAALRIAALERRASLRAGDACLEIVLVARR